jgi:predicted RNA binding protein YcfA (HicA-like mRNA interferase family)
MSRITPIHWRDFERFLFASGCKFIRERGDHRVYAKNGLKRPIVLPKKADIGVDIIKNNLRTLQIEHDKYLETLFSL